MAPIREYRSAGCQPVAVAGWLLASVCLLMAERAAGPQGPGWWIGTLWLLSAVTGAGLAAHIQQNATAGLRIAHGAITFQTGFKSTTVPFSRIVELRLAPFEIVLPSGATLRPPLACLPPAVTLAAWIAETGLPVVLHPDATPVAPATPAPTSAPSGSETHA